MDPWIPREAPSQGVVAEQQLVELGLFELVEGVVSDKGWVFELEQEPGLLAEGSLRKPKDCKADEEVAVVG